MVNPELDLALLVLMQNRETYNQYINLVDLYSLSNEGKEILQGYGVYYDIPENKILKNINLSSYTTWFMNIYKPLDHEETKRYKHIFSRLLSITPTEIDNVVSGLRYRKLGVTLLKDLGLESIIESQPISLKCFDAIKIEETIKAFNKLLTKSTDDPFKYDFATLFDPDAIRHYPTGLVALDNIIKGYRQTYSHLIVAGTDGGKTAWCITAAIEFVKDGYGKVLYFTNEHSDAQTRHRLIACAVNKKEWDFPKFMDYVTNNKEICDKIYRDIGGDNIGVVDVKSKKFDEIKRLCDIHKPGLIIIDQIDHLITIKGDGLANRPYQSMYSKVRSELAQVFAPVLMTTQATNGGAYWDKETNAKRYIEDIGSGSVSWSSYDKQGNVDVIIGLGVLNSDNTIRKITVDRHKEGLAGKCYCKLLNNSSRFINI